MSVTAIAETISPVQCRLAFATSKPLGGMDYSEQSHSFHKIQILKVIFPVNSLSFISIFRPIGKLPLTM